MNQKLPLIFDGHNDVLSKILQAGGVTEADAFLSGMNTHIDLPKASAGGFGGGFFAIWVASPAEDFDYQTMMQQAEYDIPLPAPLQQQDVLTDVMHQAAILLRLEALGALKICTTVDQIRGCLQSGTIAAIMHIEGAEAIDSSFHSLDVLYRAGLRSIGPVWSRNTIFADGVPFRFPGSPDIGNGLTPLGVELVKRCNAMGIMVDLSHLNEKGFWDVAKHSTAPLVATHSNVHEICPHSRNLTDRQLAAICESKGMVGLNFAACFLRSDGRMCSDIPIEQMIRHLDHLLNILGEDCVGLGSDFDGAEIPDDIGDTSGLPVLRAAMKNHGYDDALMTRLCHGNWLRLLEQTWT